jgi:hypothetical protein
VETQESRPVDTGGSLEVIAATTGSVADRDDDREAMPDGWHEQCDWEGRWHHAVGYADGYDAALRDIAAEITAATGVKAYSARAVLRWLIRDIKNSSAKRRAAQP